MMSEFSFGKRSLDNLVGVATDLVAVATRAIALSDVDFGVIEGLRTPERQQELLEAHASQTLQSKHIIGHAIDVAAFVGGTVSWDWPLYPRIAHAMQAASREFGIPIVFGCVWDRQLASLTDNIQYEIECYKARRSGKAFLDAGHYELRMASGFSSETV